MSDPVKWPTTEDLPNLPRLSIFDLFAEPLSGVVPDGDDIAQFTDANGKWSVYHTAKHGFVKVWRAT